MWTWWLGGNASSCYCTFSISTPKLQLLNEETKNCVWLNFMNNQNKMYYIYLDKRLSLEDIRCVGRAVGSTSTRKYTEVTKYQEDDSTLQRNTQNNTKSTRLFRWITSYLSLQTSKELKHICYVFVEDLRLSNSRRRLVQSYCAASTVFW